MENASLTSDMERSITHIQSILSSDAFIDPAAASDTIREARELCKSNGNPVPEFNSTSEGLEAFVYPISSESPKIRASTSSKIVLDGKARAIIGCIIENQSVTIKQISITTGIPVSTVEKRLSKLSSEGVLSREGSDKAGRWIINEELL